MGTVLQSIMPTKKQPFPYGSEWNDIVNLVEEKRDFVSDFMDPAVRRGDLSTNWLIEALSEFSPRRIANRPISAETISRWRQNGLLLYKEKNHPDAASAAALLTLRLLVQDKLRRWTPKIALQEPSWWCWRQDFPDAPIIPCGIPLPTDIPRHALLWTSWTGAAWDPLWLQFGAFGSARWAGTRKEEDGTIHWNLDEKDLRMWGGNDIIKYEQGLLDTVAKMARHTTATLLLLSRASTQLKKNDI